MTIVLTTQGGTVSVQRAPDAAVASMPFVTSSQPFLWAYQEDGEPDFSDEDFAKALAKADGPLERLAQRAREDRSAGRLRRFPE